MDSSHAQVRAEGGGGMEPEPECVFSVCHRGALWRDAWHGTALHGTASSEQDAASLREKKPSGARVIHAAGRTSYAHHVKLILMLVILCYLGIRPDVTARHVLLVIEEQERIPLLSELCWCSRVTSGQMT